MRSFKAWQFVVVALVSSAATAAWALPLVTSLSETGTGLNANAAIVTSASSRLPQPEGVYTSGALEEEAYAYITRTHEYTAVRTDPAGVLDNELDDTLQPFPSYLNGLEYVQIANENRTVVDYGLNVTLSAPAKAYLFVDNRANGDTGTNNSPATDDPVLTGNLAWVVSDGWTRVNTGFMPNGQADYLGLDEGGTVANATLRVHHDPGPGVGLNNYFAIYSKDFSNGSHVGLLKSGNITNINFLGVAFAPGGPPAIPGDTDGDGTVELEDFNPIRDNFRKAVTMRTQGDLVPNGIVDFNDFRQWKNAFLGAGGSVEGLDLSLAAVPEPAACVLFSLAAAFAACVRRPIRPIDQNRT